MQRKQRFVADQREDLPHYEASMGYIEAEFNAYNRAFFTPENKVIKNWTIENAGGLTVRVNKTTLSLLMNSRRAGREGIIIRDAIDPTMSINISDNTTNYVEVQIYSTTDVSDTVAIWDTTANGNAGEEYTQTINLIDEDVPVLVANTIAFSGDADKLPLAIVTTSGGVITNITDARDLFFHLSAPWNFGVSRTDKTIGSIKDMYDALATAFLEIKGSSSTVWVDKPWSTLKILREYQNMFFTGGGSIGFEGTYPANTVGWSAPITIEIAGRTNTYQIATGTVALNDGQCAYVTIPEGVAGGPLTLSVADLTAVPVNPTSVGSDVKIMVVFFRRSNTIHGTIGMEDLASGESTVIGQALPLAVKTRLGIVDDVSYEAYTSTTVFNVGDNYSTALSALDAAVNGILNNVAIEEEFPVGPGGQTIFNASTITWLASNSTPDIQVYVDGRKQIQDSTGGLNKDYRKNSDTQIEFSYTVPENAVVLIRDERTGGGGGGGGGTDLTNINSDIQPVTNGAKSVGTVTKAWKDVFLKDTLSSQVYRLYVEGGVLKVDAVP